MARRRLFRWRDRFDDRGAIGTKFGTLKILERNITPYARPNRDNTGVRSIYNDGLQNQIQYRFTTGSYHRIFFKIHILRLTAEQINSIPTNVFKSTRSSHQKSCHVCLNDFKDDELVSIKNKSLTHESKTQNFLSSIGYQNVATNFTFVASNLGSKHKKPVQVNH